MASYMGTRLASLTGLEGDYKQITWTDWKTVETTFTVPEDAVTEDLKYLAFSYFISDGTVADYYTICLDDIHIEGVTQQVGDINFDGVIDDKDLAEMKLILLGITTDYKFEIANVNSDDNEINILDLVSLNEMVKKTNRVHI